MHELYHTLTDALCLAERGYQIFPLAPGSKVPLAGSRGLRDATGDEQSIRQWWALLPDSNIAVATGRGLAVLDIDPRHGGDATIAGLERRYGRFPDAPRVRSGGDDGGHHVYFRADRPVRTRRIAAGVELRAAGAYIVAPASTHPNGRPYRWERGSGPPWLAELPPLPEWVLDTEALGAAPVPLRAAETARAGQRSALGDALAAALQDVSTLAAVLPVLGISPAAALQLSEPGAGSGAFVCPLGCGERHPSASLWRHPKTGAILVRSWHACRGLEYLTLAMAHAGQSGAGWRWLAGAELAAWSLRLLIAAGVVPTVEPDPPPDAPATARHVAAAFAQAVAAATALGVAAPGVAFTRRFGAALTGLPEASIRCGWEWLRDREHVIEAAARVGRGAALWRPRQGVPP